eukprot:1306171-Alexandrium_andersonii.AAC.1
MHEFVQEQAYSDGQMLWTAPKGGRPSSTRAEALGLLVGLSVPGPVLHRHRFGERPSGLPVDQAG